MGMVMEIKKLNIAPPSNYDNDNNYDYDKEADSDTYYLYHKYDLILTVSRGQVIIENTTKLPFDLRHDKVVTYEHWLSWLKRRIHTISRTYLNQLYKQRRLGRGHVEVINDSAAIASTDLFWVTRPHLNHNWDKLQQLRDESEATVRASLNGEVDLNEMNKIIKYGATDHTSTLTVKGAFPKAVYKGSILKKGSNAHYEEMTYKLGYRLGFDVAHAEMIDKETVACEIFTSEEISMTHAQEYLYPFNPITMEDIYERALDVFKWRPDIYKQLERLFLLNYLVANFDLHGENFGFLYDSDTFEIIKLAPAYDFNSAYDFQEDTLAYDLYIMNMLPIFMKHNRDLINQLEQIEHHLADIRYMTNEQRKHIIERAKYLISISEN